MIHVEPPDDWEPPQQTQTGSVPTASNADSSIGEAFDDIDKILSQSQSVRPVKKKSANGKRGKSPSSPSSPVQRKGSRSAPKPTANPARQDRDASAPAKRPKASPDQEPVLPTGQWVSDEARKRKRFVLMLVGSIGALLLSASVITAIVFNLPDSGVADNDDAQGKKTISKPASDGSEAENSKPTDRLGDDQVGNNADSDLLDDGDPLGEGLPAALGPAAVIADDPPPIIPDVPAIDDTSSGDSERSQQDQALSKEGFSTPFAGTDKIGTSDKELPTDPPNLLATDWTARVDDQLGELSALLQQNDLSLLEIQDLAAANRSERTIGVPKYFIERPKEDRIDLEKLELPVNGLVYQSAPLARVVRDLSTLSGIPMTIDAESIVTAKLNPNPLITTQPAVEQTNIRGALLKILEPFGLSFVTDSVGITITVEFPDEMSTAVFDVPPVPGIQQEGKQRFLVAVQTLIEPESWTRDENPATIELVDGKMSVKCNKQTQAQIAAFIDKLGGALVLAQQPGDLDAARKVETRFKKIMPKLTAPLDFAHGPRREIGSYLNHLQSKTGVTLVVDWPSVMEQGWTPRTIIPGNIVEPTTESVTAELARAMSLETRWVDEQTMVLTTFEEAAQSVDLEVYPVGALIAQGIANPDLLIQQTLGAQLQSERVRFIYEPRCQCLIVLAPQTIQRQIEVVLDRF